MNTCDRYKSGQKHSKLATVEQGEKRAETCKFIFLNWTFNQGCCTKTNMLCKHIIVTEYVLFTRDADYIFAENVAKALVKGMMFRQVVDPQL